LSGCWLACRPGALEESITGRVAYILRERDAKRADAPPDIHFAGPTIRTGQMRRTIFLLRCLGAACFQATACSPVALGQTPEGLPQLGQQELIQGIIQAIKESNFGPPIEVTDVLKAPVSSSEYWIVCIRGTTPRGPKNWTYTIFFKEQYTRSRYSADYDGCGGQQYHPFSPPSPTPPPAPAPPTKKPHRLH